MLRRHFQQRSPRPRFSHQAVALLSAGLSLPIHRLRGDSLTIQTMNGRTNVTSRYLERGNDLHTRVLLSTRGSP